MTTDTKIAAIPLVGVVICLIVALLLPQTKPPALVKSPEPQTELQHRREVWVSALEWCESRGYFGALNPMDRDGTPSFSNFQWKPETLLGYGKKYGLIPETAVIEDSQQILKDYPLQRKIVLTMIDDKDVNWRHEFPDCVKNKVGLPPIK